MFLLAIFSIFFHVFFSCLFADHGKIIKAVNAESADTDKKLSSVVIEELDVLPSSEPIRNLEIIRTMQYGKYSKRERKKIVFWSTTTIPNRRNAYSDLSMSTETNRSGKKQFIFVSITFRLNFFLICKRCTIQMCIGTPCDQSNESKSNLIWESHLIWDEKILFWF